MTLSEIRSKSLKTERPQNELFLCLLLRLIKLVFWGAFTFITDI